MSRPSTEGDPVVARRAAEWVARRDRGLTAAEQDDYLQWLQADPVHAQAIARHEAALRRMMQLGSWQPAGSPEPNPDLFAPPRRRRSVWLVLGAGLAAAASVGLFFRSAPPVALPVPAAPTSYLRVNEREALPDGSVIELKDGSRFETAFTAGERRVRLQDGEAHFQVAKDGARPFVVEAGGVAVRAVGTAFNVRLDGMTVEVLVTEGRVKLQSGLAGEPPADAPLAAAGQRAFVTFGNDALPVWTVSGVDERQIAEVLAWQAPRLQFHETPLAEAVEAFNRHTDGPRIVLGDAALGSRPIGGTFRLTNVEGFVRLLETTLGLRARREADGTIVLQPVR